MFSYFCQLKDNKNHISRDILRLPLYSGITVQDDSDSSLETFLFDALEASKRTSILTTNKVSTKQN